MATSDYIIVVCFLLGIYCLGTYFQRWVGSPDDFYVAGRQLTPFILASALTTANISLYSFVGVSGIAYRDGISIIWQTWTGNMALALSGMFVIPILRRLRIRTIPEFLEMRYNGVVRLMVSAVWIFRLAAWLGTHPYVLADALTIHAYKNRVREDFTSGVRSGVNGTPTFYLNGARYDDGICSVDPAPPPYDSFIDYTSPVCAEHYLHFHFV